MRRLDPVKNALENACFLLLFPFPPPLSFFCASLVAQLVKNPPAMWETFSSKCYLFLWVRAPAPFSLPSSSGAVFQCLRASHLEVSVDLSAGVSGLSSEDLPEPLALGREPVHLCSHGYPCPSSHGPCRTQLLPRGTSAGLLQFSLWALLCFPGVHLATLVTSAYPNPQL